MKEEKENERKKRTKLILSDYLSDILRAVDLGGRGPGFYGC